MITRICSSILCMYTFFWYNVELNLRARIYDKGNFIYFFVFIFSSMSILYFDKDQHG